METYGLSKLINELTANMINNNNHNITIISLRFPNIIKKEQWCNLPWDESKAFESGGIIMWSYIHENDVILSHIKAIDMICDHGHHVLLLSAPNTRYKTDTRILLNKLYGNHNIIIHNSINSNQTIFNNNKAYKMLNIKFKSWDDDYNIDNSCL